MKYLSIIIAVLAITVIGVIYIVGSRNSKSSPQVSPTPTLSQIPTPVVSEEPTPVVSPSPSPIATSPTPQEASQLVEPIKDFRQRITKKSFGTYVTPKDSPVQPERFMGYHSGVDVEYQDVTEDVPVFAITDGTVVQSNTVSGYGGVIVIEHTINGTPMYVLYGHLRASSMVGKGRVTKGQRIGVLGTGYSSETDNERRNFHFSIRKPHSMSVKGYVQSKAELNDWYDPLAFYK